MPVYLVKQPLNYNHDDYAVGDTVTMGAKDAQALLELDVLEEAVETGDVAPTQNPVKPTDDVELSAAIVDAVASLEKGDASLWTKDGKAQVAAIASVLGYEVSAAERDAAVPVETTGATE